MSWYCSICQMTVNERCCPICDFENEYHIDDADKNRFIAETLEPAPAFKDAYDSDIGFIQSLWDAGEHDGDEQPSMFHLSAQAMMMLIKAMEKEKYSFSISSSFDVNSDVAGKVAYFRNGHSEFVGRSADGNMMLAVRDAAFKALKAREGRE